MENPFVKIYRKLGDNPIASDIQMLGLFTYLLLKANYKESFFFYRGSKVILKPGELVISQRKLSEQFSISLGKINKMLKILVDEHICEQSSDPRFTIIRFINWDMYQVKNEHSNEQGEKNDDFTILGHNLDCSGREHSILEKNEQSVSIVEYDPELLSLPVAEPWLEHSKKEENEREMNDSKNNTNITYNTLTPTNTTELSNSVILQDLEKNLACTGKEKTKRKNHRNEKIQVIEAIQKECEALGLAYSNQDAWKYAQLIVTGKEIKKCAMMSNFTICEYCVAIMRGALAIKFWKGAVTGPLSIYMNHAEIYNKVKTMEFFTEQRSTNDHSTF